MHGVKPRQGECGYCKKENAYMRSGLRCFFIKMSNYELMINRGWCHSGTYFYKPSMSESCCQSHVTRIEAAKFVMKKS